MGADPILVCSTCHSTMEVGHHSDVVINGTLDALIKTRTWQTDMEDLMDWEVVLEWFREHKTHDIWYDPRW